MYFVFTLRGDSIHGTVTRLQATCPRNRGKIPRRDNRFISSPKPPDLCWSPPNLLFHVTDGHFQEIWRPGCDVGHASLARLRLKLSEAKSQLSFTPMDMHMDKTSFILLHSYGFTTNQLRY